jgi:alpha-L-fucosidase
MNMNVSSISSGKRLNIQAFVLVLCLITTIKKAEAQVPMPTSSQLAWQHAELGVVFHYDLHVFDNKKYNQAINRITPIADYNIFNPVQLNTDQWIRAAKDAGATFAILTVTHETGFALYQSDVNPYSLKAVKWQNGKGDILRDFVNSCEKYGVKPAIYIGIRWNSFMGVHDFVMQGNTAFSKNRQAYYNRYCEKMTTELVTRYGKFFFIWFDGGAHGPEQGGPDILPIVEKYQPEAIFYHNLQRADVRWGGSESGTVPYPCWATFNYPSWFQHSGAKENFNPIKYGYPDGKYYMPAMADAPLRGYKGRHEWFWEPGDEAHIFPVAKLMDMYYGSVGHNATLILGLTPNADGLLPQQDVDTLKAFGEAVKSRFKNPIAFTKGNAKEIALKIPKGKTFDQIVIAEEIEKGQRVREFIVQVYRKRRWETIVSGTSVGHKFIKRLPEPVSSEKVRLVIEKSINEPLITQFALY